MTTTADERDMLVRRRTEPADAIVMLELVSADGSELPSWQPGAHIDVLLTEGIERQYSLCGDPADRAAWTICVLREPAGRGGSERIFRELTERATVRIRGPRNHFPMLVGDRYRFIAGGIGITPLLSMIRAADRLGADWQLDYAGRSRRSMPFLDDLLAQHGDRIAVHAKSEGARFDLHGLLVKPKLGTLVYCCGPQRMVDVVENASNRWPEGALRWERFEAKQYAEPISQQSFDVELMASGLTLTVPPERSILEMVENAGVLVLSSCQEGTCGTCETPVLEGEVQHRDSVLTPSEQESNTTMMICCSRSVGTRLVLDL